MLLGASSLVVAGLLAFHPFGSALAGSAGPQPDPSWNEAEPTEAETTEAEPTDDVGDPADALAPAPEPSTEPAEPTAESAEPGVVPPAVGLMPVMRPEPSKGIGLMVGAGVTGGLAWLTVFGRLAAIDRCQDAVGTAVIGGGGAFNAFGECLRSAGSMFGLTLLGYGLNSATYGLAPAAGAVRGKYDGVRAAWDGAPERNAPVLVGVGAGLLGAGVVGRLATIVVFWRQLNIERLFGKYPLTAHFVLAQLSAASIQGGAGMLSYGLTYKKHRKSQDDLRKAAGIAQLRLAPQLGWDYTGLSLNGRF
ncbi:hypothetical protein [Paraliomyxa miuraensis]|uniref:hypothetical protein n=1 Tax=Paraliomyxa miuraensis TaxID=376150 RepID=UPI00225024CC|nr:hypothetical protein [Paraliomyxa miuraensis]MCX4243050.1 hypothetical protein [Paraliomyxa miuraensis]